MKFTVLTDGRIVTENGRQVGTIDITETKYRDEIIGNIETQFPVFLIPDIITDYFPNTYSSEPRVIKDIIEKTIGETKAFCNFIEIVSIINFYR